MNIPKSDSVFDVIVENVVCRHAVEFLVKAVAPASLAFYTARFLKFVGNVKTEAGWAGD